MGNERGNENKDGSGKKEEETSRGGGERVVGQHTAELSIEFSSQMALFQFCTTGEAASYVRCRVATA